MVLCQAEESISAYFDSLLQRRLSGQVCGHRHNGTRQDSTPFQQIPYLLLCAGWPAGWKAGCRIPRPAPGCGADAGPGVCTWVDVLVLPRCDSHTQNTTFSLSLQDGQDALRCISTGGSSAGSTPASAKGKGKAAPASKQAGASVNVELAEDWVVEHARQVSRMLTGGGCPHQVLFSVPINTQINTAHLKLITG